MSNKRRPCITEFRVLKLLAERHSADVFVAECKNGPTIYASGMVRLDAWVLERKWARPRTIGYEIKVSRQDFLRDTKWARYLDYCNEFYFVAPDGVIQSLDELGPAVGWLRVASTGTRLFTRKKAPYREVEIPRDLYRYVLMARAFITRNSAELERATGLRDAEYWKDWLDRRGELWELGGRVSRRICDQAQTERAAARREIRSLKAQIERITGGEA